MSDEAIEEAALRAMIRSGKIKAADLSSLGLGGRAVKGLENPDDWAVDQGLLPSTASEEEFRREEVRATTPPGDQPVADLSKKELKEREKSRTDPNR